MQVSLIYGVLFIALFGGAIETIGIPSYFTAATELFIILLFLTSAIGKGQQGGYVIHLWYLFFYILLVAIVSIVVNNSGMLSAIYSIRLIFRFYFFYLAITTLDLDDETIKKINFTILIFLILQLPVVAYKFYHYGISELTIGAYTKIGGAVTAMLPVALLFYLAGYYFLYRPDFKYIILAMGYILFSIVGKKRAMLFLYPSQFVAIYYYIYVKGKLINFSKKVSRMFVAFGSIVVISSLILYFNPTLNPEGEVGGSIDVKYALEYTKDYTTRVDTFGYTSGRVGTTGRILSKLWNAGFTEFFLGIGPGSLTESILDPVGQRKSIEAVKDSFMFQYGVTSMTRLALEYGILAVIAFSLVLFFYARMCWRYYRAESDPYWQAFAAGSVGFSFSMLFFYFAYNDAAFWGDTMPALFFYAMAVIYTKMNRIKHHQERSDT